MQHIFFPGHQQLAVVRGDGDHDDYNSVDHGHGNNRSILDKIPSFPRHDITPPLTVMLLYMNKQIQLVRKPKGEVTGKSMG